MYRTRVKVFLAIIFVAMVVLVGRLVQLQIILGQKYRDEYEDSSRFIQFLPAARGTILDRTGRILAVDMPCKDFCLDYRFITSDPRWIDRQKKLLQEHLGVSAERAEETYHRRAEYTWQLADRLAARTQTDLSGSVRRLVSRVNRIRRSVARRSGIETIRIREEIQAHPLILGLSAEAATDIETEIHAGMTIGASVRPSHTRYYPYASDACHVIGLIGPVTAEDLRRLNQSADSTDWRTRRRDIYEPDDTLGICGAEKMCEPLLRGRRGYRVLESGWAQPLVLEAVAAEAGKDVHLTIDLNLQQAITERLRETGHNGAAVVIAVDSGEILAMASVPTYDLNRYREVLEDPGDPLVNRAVAGLYPPGSVAKPMVALAALAEGKITPQTTFQCSGHLFANDPARWRCTGVHGEVALSRSIMKSCNIYYYHLGDILGAPLLCKYFREFGLDEPSGVGLPEEKGGSIPSLEWLRSRETRRRGLASPRQMGIGQGPILVTPMGVANAMAIIARNGRVVPPVVTREQRRDGKESRLSIGEEHFAPVRQGMWRVVNEPGGTAYRAFHPPGATPLGVAVCGKTGTAQTGRRAADGRGVHMAWFGGFAPAEKPKIAFAVLVANVPGGGGASNAGPVARRIVQLCKEGGHLDDR
jgi:penicillin-binding protein 2